jgi:hypothetical protein
LSLLVYFHVEQAIQVWKAEAIYTCTSYAKCFSVLVSLLVYFHVEQVCELF